MPDEGDALTVKGMRVEEVADRVASWIRAHTPGVRLGIEAAAAVVYLAIALSFAATSYNPIALFAILLLGSTFLLYRRVPIVALFFAGFGGLAVLLTGWGGGTPPGPIWAPVLVALFGSAAYGVPVTRWLGLVGAVIAGLSVSATNWYASGLFFLVVFWIVFFAAPWLAGMLWRTWNDRQKAQTGEISATVKLGEAKQEVTLEQERNRVARDVHDIVAHSLAVVIAQADGARYGAKNVPAPVVEALENIATTARGALTDVRVLLGELRHNQEAGPQPGMNDLDALVRGFRDSGLEIEWNSYGTAVELTDAPALAVYRIVQEGLTNALRHGDRGQPVELVFDWGSASLAVIVTNGIPRDTTVPANPAGHGIPGMRERATLAGGELEASDGTNGRFRVRATIPFTSTSTSAAVGSVSA